MTPLILTLRRLLVEEEGPTAVEYAVMLSLIIAVCVSAVTTIGQTTSSVFSNVANSI
jgi:pilus assembly protein Flp/PilA